MLSSVIGDIWDPDDFHDLTWRETGASAIGLDYFVKTGRVNPTDPSLRTPGLTIQQEYDQRNPRGKGKWWEFVTLPWTFLWRY